MRLDFNETNILVTTLDELNKTSKGVVKKNHLEEALYARGLYTDRKFTVLRMSVKSLIKKVEELSEEDVAKIVADSKDKKIAASVCYQLPDAKGTKI